MSNIVTFSCILSNFIEVCENTHDNCGKTPGWADKSFCPYHPDIPRYCPLMCELCGEYTRTCSSVSKGTFNPLGNPLGPNDRSRVRSHLQGPWARGRNGLNRTAAAVGR